MSTRGDRVADGTTGSGSDPSPDLPAPLALDAETAAALLRIAREAVTAAVTHRTAAVTHRSPAPTGAAGTRPSGTPESAAPPLSPATSGELDEPGAAFVTLTERGSLRGCVGSLVAEQPLGQAVASAGA